MSINLEALTDLCTPWCIHVAVTLNIPEHVAAGRSNIVELASATQANHDALHAMLSHLVSKGIFVEPAPGQFQLNEPANTLREPGMRVGLDLNGIGGRMAHVWSTMLAYVKTGEPAYYEVFGKPFWEDLDAHPDVAASFDALIGPTGHGTPDAAFQLTIPWPTVRSIADVGGGTGAMLAAILARHPHLTATLVDLPRTVARAGSIARAELIGQSFFDALPPGHDVYLLRGVLNDWPDSAAIAILKRCREAAGPQGRVVVLKSVGPANEHRHLNIEMLLAGGKHRSIDDFHVLAEAAGLRVIAATRQAAYFVVECTV